MRAAVQLSGIASFLFIPAGNERLLTSALSRPADAIIVDLEDAIPAERKISARDGLARDLSALRKGAARIGVRVNRPWTLLIDDLKAAVSAGVDFLMLPKVENGFLIEEVAHVLRELEAHPSTFLISQIESGRAFGRLDEIARTAPEWQASLMLGPEDLAVDLNADSSREVMTHYAQQLIAASRGNGLVPIGSPGSIAEISDMDAYRDQIEAGRRIGFGAVAAIHPRQLDVINSVYTPSEAQVTAARTIMDLDQHHDGKPFLHNGKMIDAPIVARAAQTLALARSRKART